jgi:hypothetical protein
MQRGRAMVQVTQARQGRSPVIVQAVITVVWPTAGPAPPEEVVAHGEWGIRIVPLFCVSLGRHTEKGTFATLLRRDSARNPSTHVPWDERRGTSPDRGYGSASEAPREARPPCMVIMVPGAAHSAGLSDMRQGSADHQ